MDHPTSEEMLDLLYDPGDDRNDHLAHCAECREKFKALRESLEAFDEYRIPERGEEYGEAVWNRIAGRLPRTQRGRHFSSIWSRLRRPMVAIPALGSLLCMVFGLGIWTGQERTAAASKVRERVLLMAMSDHLERSDIVLTELLRNSPREIDLPEERKRARALVDENRLLRQTARHLGDESHALLLDDLGRALIDLANTPDDAPAAELKQLQQRIERNGLLLKLRKTSLNVARRGNVL